MDDGIGWIRFIEEQTNNCDDREIDYSKLD